MNIIPTAEIRAQHLADARADFEQKVTEPGAWDRMIAELRQAIKDQPATARGEFMLFLIMRGVRPDWADAMATEVGVVEYSDEAVAKTKEIIEQREAAVN